MKSEEEIKKIIQRIKITKNAAFRRGDDIRFQMYSKFIQTLDEILENKSKKNETNRGKQISRRS